MKGLYKAAIIIPAFYLFCSTLGLSQYTSTNGDFEVDNIRGCDPLTINITNNISDTSGVTLYWYEGIESRDDEDTATVYTYQAPGTYMLYQITREGANITRVDSLGITVFENIPPSYDVFKCNGNQALVFITDTNYDQYEVDYDINDPTNTPIIVNQGNSVPSYTYPASGNYDISVRGFHSNAKDNCNDSIQSVNVVSTLQPAQLNGVTVMNDSEIMIDYSLSPNIRYSLEVAINNNSNYQNVTTLDNNSTTFTLPNLTTEFDTYCFRISTIDVCNSQVISSPSICSIQFQLDIQNNQNVLNWETIDAGINNFSIFRDGSQLVNEPASQRKLIDNFVDCNVDYCYRVTANYSNGSSVSLNKCGTAFSSDKPETIKNISVDTQGSNLEITTSTPQNFTPDTYFVSRSVDGEPYTFFDSLDINSFTDGDLNTGESIYCYQITYKDVCDNTSDPATGCSLLLTGKFDPLQNALLSWNEYIGWEEGPVSYVIEIRDLNDQIVQTINVGNSLEYSFSRNDFTTQVMQFRVRANTFAVGMPNTNSNVIELTLRPRLSVPNAFSPNGDGLNDTFSIRGRFVSTFEITIFNRWGEIVFYSSDIDRSWDGQFRGRSAPPGTYAYRIDYRDTIDRKFSKSGSIVLLDN